MESQRIDMFLVANGRYFPPESMAMIRSYLEKADDNKFIVIQSIGYKDPSTIIIVSIFGGFLGIDRFMIGDTGLGVAKLLTCGGLGVWKIVDWFLIMGRTREVNMNNLIRALSY